MTWRQPTLTLKLERLQFPIADAKSLCKGGHFIFLGTLFVCVMKTLENLTLHCLLMLLTVTYDNFIMYNVLQIQNDSFKLNQGLYKNDLWCKYELPSRSPSEDTVLTRVTWTDEWTESSLNRWLNRCRDRQWMDMAKAKRLLYTPPSLSRGINIQKICSSPK